VLKALRKAGINVVAIHQHMVGEEPRIMFLHYWGVAPVADFTKGLRSAASSQDLRFETISRPDTPAAPSSTSW